jgi:hypothetical protein
LTTIASTLVMVLAVGERLQVSWVAATCVFTLVVDVHTLRDGAECKFVDVAMNISHLVSDPDSTVPLGVAIPLPLPARANSAHLG